MGHGRLETRELQASARLVGHLDWPGFAQAIRITRSNIADGEDTTEVSYAITSLSQDRVSTEQLLSFKCGHWGIENRENFCKAIDRLSSDLWSDIFQQITETGVECPLPDNVLARLSLG